MDLKLDIEPVPAAEYVRDLSVEDLSRLDETPAQTAIQRLAKLRDTHHALARALAAGMRNYEAAAVTGYSEVRVSILRQDPAFQELIKHYRSVEDASWREARDQFHARAYSLMIDMVDEVRERFEESPEDMTSVFLTDTITKLADRTGHGPKSTQVNINVDLADRLEKARRRAGLIKDPDAEVIEGTVLPALIDE